MIYLRRFILWYPVGYLVLVYSSWLLARYTLGHWPVALVDDPKSIGGFFPVLGLFRDLLFFAFLFYVLIFSLLLTQSVLDAGNRLRILRDCAISFAFIAGFFLLARSDPGGVFAWLMSSKR